MKKNFGQALPVDRIKCFVKIQLDNNGGGRAVVAAAKVVSCVDKIVRNTTPQNEAGLIIHQRG